MYSGVSKLITRQAFSSIFLDTPPSILLVLQSIMRYRLTITSLQKKIKIKTSRACRLVLCSNIVCILRVFVIRHEAWTSNYVQHISHVNLRVCEREKEMLLKGCKFKSQKLSRILVQPFRLGVFRS